MIDSSVHHRMSAPEILRIGLLIVILATIIPYGAVDPFWFNLAVVLNGIVFAGTFAIPIRNPEVQKVYRTTLILTIAIGAYLYFQSMHFPQNAFTNPIWETVRDLLNLRTGAVSVDPAGTLATIPLVVHPLLIFMAALVLLQSDEPTVSFWRQLAWMGGGIAAFGIVQHFVFPNSLLLGEKQHYLDSVTGTFVNRNSAATLFGVAALVILGLLVRLIQQFDSQRRRREHESQGGSADHQTTLMIYAGVFVVTLLALFLTGSRGGLISTFVPLALVTVWFGISFLPPEAPVRVRVGLGVAAAAVVAIAFTVLGARSLFRLERGGVEDVRWCVYDSTLSAIADHPWLGTGLGTFREVFSVYRAPECGIVGVWERAHNSFLEGYLGMGFSFAIIATFVIIYLLQTLLVGYRTRRRFRVIPLIGIAILLLVVLHSLVDFSLQIPGVAAYVAAALGAAVSVSVARRRSAAQRFEE